MLLFNKPFESGAETAAVPRVGGFRRGRVVAPDAQVKGPVADQDGPTEYAVNANKLRHISSTMCLRSEVVQSLVCSVSFHLHRQSWLGIGSPVSAMKMTQLGG